MISTAANVTNYKKLAEDRYRNAGKNVHEVDWTYDVTKETPPPVATFTPTAALPPPEFKSEEAKACWTYFLNEPKTPQGTALAVAQCKRPEMLDHRMTLGSIRSKVIRLHRPRLDSP